MALLLFGCIRRLFILALLLLLAAGVWLIREPLLDRWSELRGGAAGRVVAGDEPPAVSPADAAAAKLAALARTDGPARVALDESEAEALLLGRLLPGAPAYLLDPELRLDGDRARLLTRLVVPALPAVEQLGEIAAFLPDTADVAVTGQLLPIDADRVALALDEITAERIPLPRRLVPTLLERFGREDAPGLPPDALALPLPAGADAAYIRRDSLILLRGGAERDG